MVNMGLVFVGITLLVLLGLLLASVYFVPQVLSEEEHGEGDEDHGSGSHPS